MFLKMSRNNRVCFAAVAVFVLATTLMANTDAATFTVGDKLGWSIPTDATTYTTFASQDTYTVGDVLVFNFPTGQHDVAPVLKEAYDECNSSAAISLLTVGPARVTLSFAGTHYFICTFGQHCQFGQKLAVNVTASSPIPSPLPSPIPQITPSPSSLPLPPSPTAAPPAPPLPGTPSPLSMPPSEGPTPSGSAPGPSEGPSTGGSAPGPSEGPSPSDSASPPFPPSDGSPAPGPLPGGDDGTPSSPNSAAKAGLATIYVWMFISSAVCFMF